LVALLAVLKEALYSAARLEHHLVALRVVLKEAPCLEGPMEALCLEGLMEDPKGAQWEELMVIRRLEPHLDFLILQED
jgi:hypothetical protein